MILIVGLGNPGEKYEGTRHNLGFMVIDRLVQEWKISPHAEKKLSSLVFNQHEKETVIARPQTAMNASGLTVAKLVNFYKVKPENLWVIHDDVDLALGRIKIVRGKGSAGHRGVMSIIKQLGTVDFVRFRLGIGHPHAGRRMERNKKITKFDSQEETEDFVLAPFFSAERDEVKRLIKKTIEAIEFALEDGLEKAMNRFNQ